MEYLNFYILYYVEIITFFIVVALSIFAVINIIREQQEWKDHTRRVKNMYNDYHDKDEYRVYQSSGTVWYFTGCSLAAIFIGVLYFYG